MSTVLRSDWETCGVGAASRGEGVRVPMTLMRSEIDRLYSAASVAAYRPEPVLAQLEDGTAEVALCFNLPTAPDGATTNSEYAAALQSVARKVGLPEHYATGLSG
jgi:hypothetical protein